MENRMISTDASKMQPDLYSKYKSVTFERYVKKSSITNPSKEMNAKQKTNEFEIRAARMDVIKFGMQGFRNKRKTKTAQQLAVELGAKPEGKKFRNYKELTKIKKKNKDKREKRKKLAEVHKSTRKIHTLKSKTKNRKK